MSYNFNKVLDLHDQNWINNLGVNSQQAAFKKAINSITKNTKRIAYKNVAQKVADAMFADGKIENSQLLNQIAELGDKKIKEQFQDIDDTKRPSRFKKENVPIEELKQRITQLQYWIKELYTKGVISIERVITFNNEYNKLKQQLDQSLKKLSQTEGLSIKNTDSLIKNYNQLNETLRISSLLESVAFVAEKGAAFITNNLDGYAENITEDVINKYHSGSQRSATRGSTKGMTKEMRRELEHMGYKNTGVKGVVQYQNETFDKADFTISYLFPDETNQNFGVSLKTGGQSFSLQGQSRLFAYLSQSFFMEQYTNNLIKLMFGQGPQKPYDDVFKLAKQMIIFTALVGYESQGEKRAQLMMHINTENRSVSFYPVTEAIKHIIEKSNKNVNITTEPTNIFSHGGLNTGVSKPELTFLHAYVSVSVNNIHKLLGEQDNIYTAYAKRT